MSPPEPHYWFNAKRFGWGWGFPRVWQGWAVLGAWVLLMVVAYRVFPPPLEQAKFLACMAVLAIALVAVCWWKGEPPRWRWGNWKP